MSGNSASVCSPQLGAESESKTVDASIPICGAVICGAGAENAAEHRESYHKSSILHLMEQIIASQALIAQRIERLDTKFKSTRSARFDYDSSEDDAPEDDIREYDASEDTVGEEDTRDAVGRTAGKVLTAGKCVCCLHE